MTIVDLEQCIDLYGKDIYSFCCYATGSIQEGEELYQDTFLKAVELIDRIDYEKNAKSYILSIAVKLWKNKKRKFTWRQRIASVDSLEAVDECINVTSDNENTLPENDLLQKEQNELIHACIQKLPYKYRVVVYLYYSSEFSVNEIAECLKLPEGTIKSRLHKARKLVKEKLEAVGYVE